MSDADLNALERDVEQARARFADDLARLRSPSHLARFKDDAWAEARETKDELVGKTKEAAKDGAQRLFTELKERAAANPVAALAIGAGLAWRLVHRPPIATLLVGMGVVGLLRTSPARNSEPYMGLHDEDPRLLHRYGAREPGLAARAGELADVVKDKVQDWSAEAGDAGTRDRNPSCRNDDRGGGAGFAGFARRTRGCARHCRECRRQALRRWRSGRPMACMTPRTRPASPRPV